MAKSPKGREASRKKRILSALKDWQRSNNEARHLHSIQRWHEVAQQSVYNNARCTSAHKCSWGLWDTNPSSVAPEYQGRDRCPPPTKISARPTCFMRRAVPRRRGCSLPNLPPKPRLQLAEDLGFMEQCPGSKASREISSWQTSEETCMGVGLFANGP